MWNWNQLGECVDITNPNWKELDNKYDLSQIANGTSSGLCGVSADESCCRCMKKKTTKKTCKDTGCEKKFGGKGIHIAIW